MAMPSVSCGLSYFTAPVCASGEARTAITWHGWSEWWLMA
jgi:hypothetical protein